LLKLQTLCNLPLDLIQALLIQAPFKEEMPKQASINNTSTIQLELEQL
jgi:hypothetical protein